MSAMRWKQRSMPLSLNLPSSISRADYIFDFWLWSHSSLGMWISLSSWPAMSNGIQGMVTATNLAGTVFEGFDLLTDEQNIEHRPPAEAVRGGLKYSPTMVGPSLNDVITAKHKPQIESNE